MTLTITYYVLTGRAVPVVVVRAEHHSQWATYASDWEELAAGNDLMKMSAEDMCAACRELAPSYASMLVHAMDDAGVACGPEDWHADDAMRMAVESMGETL